jgi:hypothetical protein
MDSTLKDVSTSIKLQCPSNYILWNYKVKMILLQDGLWKYVEGIGVISSSTSAWNIGTATLSALNTITATIATAMATPVQQPAMNTNEQRYRAGRITISTLKDDIMLSVVTMTDPKHIWTRLQHSFDVQSSSQHLALREELYSLRPIKEKTIAEHIQKINLGCF